jgi:hypothetical protein
LDDLNYFALAGLRTMVIGQIIVTWNKIIKSGVNDLKKK